MQKNVHTMSTNFAKTLVWKLSQRVSQAVGIPSLTPKPEVDIPSLLR